MILNRESVYIASLIRLFVTFKQFYTRKILYINIKEIGCMVNLGKLGAVVNKDIVAWAKVGKSNSLLATKPVAISGSGLRYAPKLESDVFQTTKKLVKADNYLFSWAKQKPEFSMTQLNPDSLALVHMTNYYPKDGQILSTYMAGKTAEGVGAARTTIHFALNKSVTEHTLGNAWNTMDYAIIAPFRETVKNMPKSKVIGGIQDDFFFQDVVKLPKESVIVKYNPKIGSGDFLVSETPEGIKLVETSNRKLNEAVNVVINKMGYTTYNDALKKFLGASESEMQLLTSRPATEVKEIFNQIKISGGVNAYKELLQERLKSLDIFMDMPNGKEIINQNKEAIFKEMEWIKLYEKFSEKLDVFPKTWENFCSKKGYINELHSQTPWFKTEMGINAIEIIEKVNKNSWGDNLKQILIKSLNDSMDALPQGKNLGYDVKKVVKILEESETPKIAKERLQKELKLKPMPPRSEAQDFYKIDGDEDGEDIVELMFQFFGLG